MGRTTFSGVKGFVSLGASLRMREVGDERIIKAKGAFDIFRWVCLTLNLILSFDV